MSLKKWFGGEKVTAEKKKTKLEYKLCLVYNQLIAYAI